MGTQGSDTFLAWRWPAISDVCSIPYDTCAHQTWPSRQRANAPEIRSDGCVMRVTDRLSRISNSEFINERAPFLGRKVSLSSQRLGRAHGERAPFFPSTVRSMHHM